MRMCKGKCPVMAFRGMAMLAAVLFLSFATHLSAVAQPLGPVPAMREIRTAHYLIRTDIESDFADEMAVRMDAMFDEYSRRLAEFTPDREFKVMDVYLFQRKQDYMAFTHNRFPNTGGIFISGRQNLLAGFLESQGRDALRRVLHHEAFHQFAHVAISPNLPIWLNEGLAQVFEEGLWTGSTFILGQVPPRRLRQLQADIDAGRMVDFEAFLGMSREQWAKNLADDANRGATQYTQAWAMVHFLIHAEDGAFRKRLIEMLKLIHDGKDADTAFRTSFSPNFKGFQKRFVDWVKDVQPAAEAVMIDRQGVLGDLLISLAEKNQRFTDMNSFRQAVTSGGYQLQYTKGEVKWKTDSRIDNYFSNTDGQLLNNRQLYFDANRQAPLPDIVCQVTDQVSLRTRFYKLNDRTWHELQIQVTE